MRKLIPIIVRILGIIITLPPLLNDFIENVYIIFLPFINSKNHKNEKGGRRLNMKLKNNLMNKLDLKSLLIVILIVATLCTSCFNVTASILPFLVKKDLEAGDCYNVTDIVVEIPAIFQKADVVFAFDLTFSMKKYDILSTAKNETEQIMNTLITSYPGADFNFGVMSHMDYPDFYSSCNYSAPYGSQGDYAYSLDQPLTNNPTAVNTTINSLSLGNDGSADAPEDYTRIFYESYNDSNIGWRAEATKLVVNFGDSVPHDCNLSEGVTNGPDSTGNDPGPDEKMDTSDDLDLQSVLASMNASGITLIECHTKRIYVDHWTYWTEITGGSFNIINSSNYVDNIVNAITGELTNLKVYNLHLNVTTPGFESWLNSVDPPSYSEVITGTTVIFNETICVPIGTPPGIYIFNVSAVDEDGVNYGNQTNEITVNAPPNVPSNPDPYDGESDVKLDATLSWTCSDPDGDPLTYDVYFGTSNPPPLLEQNQSGTGYDPTLGYDTTYYWKIIAWDNHSTSNESEIWSFTTTSAPQGDPDPPATPTYYDPIADASAGEPYIGFVGEEITFDGSRSYDPDGDGFIISWYWDFGDDTNGTGETITHTYTSSGSYSASLTVSDNRFAIGIDNFNVEIFAANYAPTKPTVGGPTKGHKNINYEFTALSYDADNNTIQYIFDWGDGETTTTEFLQNGTLTNQSHSWTKYGAYLISVKAYDGMTESDVNEFTILIDVIPINDGINGYLVDEDSDDTFDSFENTDTGEKTDLGQENNNYLIDSDNNDKWDYAYNLDTGLTSYYLYVYHKYDGIYQANKAPGFELVSLLAVIALVFIIMRRRRR